jgi:hypothetical protein
LQFGPTIRSKNAVTLMGQFLSEGESTRAGKYLSIGGSSNAKKASDASRLLRRHVVP